MATAPAPAPAAELSVFRFNLLRAAYLLLVVGLGLTIWPSILSTGQDWPRMSGVVICMLGALSALSILGLRYPLKMLPLLFFELGWKAIWLLRVALPGWQAGTLDEASITTAFECLAVVVMIPLIPWRYVAQTYFAAPADRWR
jgi:hypothetical protein